jgi:hypothetical protein
MSCFSDISLLNTIIIIGFNKIITTFSVITFKTGIFWHYWFVGDGHLGLQLLFIYMQICKIVLYLILEIAVTDKIILKVLLQCAKSAIWSLK